MVFPGCPRQLGNQSRNLGCPLGHYLSGMKMECYNISKYQQVSEQGKQTEDSGCQVENWV